MVKEGRVSPQVRAYLDRIGFEGEPEVSLECLKALQSAHLRNVPYENLDILAGVPISLDVPALYDKIVVRRRGGFCFELNSLFGWLLREIGFDVTDYFARFWLGEPNPVPKRRHQVLCVRLGKDEYLSDVGVGGPVPLLPVRIVEGEEQQQGNDIFKLEYDAAFGWRLTELHRDSWRLIYSFTTEPQLPIDYITASFWCQYAPDSIFREGAMVAIRTRDGRNTIAGQEFKRFIGDRVDVKRLDTSDAWRETLREHFGIELDDAAIQSLSKQEEGAKQ